MVYRLSKVGHCDLYVDLCPTLKKTKLYKAYLLYCLANGKPNLVCTSSKNYVQYVKRNHCDLYFYLCPSSSEITACPGHISLTVWPKLTKISIWVNVVKTICYVPYIGHIHL